MKPTMALREVGRFLVIVHSNANPSNEEWQKYVDMLRRTGPRLKGQLVYSLGGMPNSAQRALAIAVGEVELKARKARSEPFVRTAVMTDSTVVRGIATMLNWFFDNTFSGFTLDSWSGALTHLGVPPGDRDAIREAVAALETSLV